MLRDLNSRRLSEGQGAPRTAKAPTARRASKPAADVPVPGPGRPARAADVAALVDGTTPLAPVMGRRPLEASLVLRRDGSAVVRVAGGLESEGLLVARAALEPVARSTCWCEGGAVLLAPIDKHADPTMPSAKEALWLLSRADGFCRIVNDRYYAHPAARGTVGA